MSQPINHAPPWWDGNISMTFSYEEWKYIKYVLQQDFVHYGSLLGQDAHDLQSNIIDRIEKNLGEE